MQSNVLARPLSPTSSPRINRGIRRPAGNGHLHSTILVYGSLWFTDPEEIANPPKPRTTVQGWRAAKAESKLQAAELRMGFVFAMIGGATASIAKGTNLIITIITIVTICCAIAGALIGFDVKRRVRRIRGQFAARTFDDGG